jgi:ABC-type transport system substrate-binding protein
MFGRPGALLSLDYDLFQAAAFLSPVPEAQESGFTRYSLSKGTSAKHEDPKIQEFFQRLNAAVGFDERAKSWRELERSMVQEQVYLIPFSGRLSVVPYRAYVKSLPVPRENTMSLLEFATVWVAK